MREIVGEGEHAYVVAPSPGSDLLLTVDALAASLEVVWETDDTLSSSAGRIWLPLPAAEGEARVTVRSADPAGVGGSYRLRVEAAPADGTELFAAAGAAAGAAGRAWFDGGAEAEARAIEAYRRALADWRELGRPEQAAHTALALAEALRGRGDAQGALPLYEQALGDGALAAREARAHALDGRGLALLSLGRDTEAEASFETALALRREVGEPRGLGITRNNLCFVLQARGELSSLPACYDEVVRLFEAAGLVRLEALVINNLGGVYERLGEPIEARRRYRRALDLLDDEATRARVLNNLGVVHRKMGEPGEALVHYTRALDLFRAAGDRGWEARVLHNLATAYLTLGEPQRAAATLEQALALRRDLGDRRGVAYTLDSLGSARLELGEAEAAVACHREALELRRQLGDRRGEIASTSALARTLLAAGDRGEGRELLATALPLAREEGDRELLARVLVSLGEASLAAGRDAEAESAYAEALALAGELGHTQTRVAALSQLARLDHRAGRLERALARAREALDAVHALRAAVPHVELRASVLAFYRELQETRLAVLADLHRRHPDGGYAETALAAAEQGRARSLLDLLAEAGTDLRQGVSPELARRQIELRQRLHAKLELRLERLSSGAAADELARLAAEAAELAGELDRVELAVRHQSPRYAALTAPEPLDAGEIRRLLTPDTLLLEYALGEERSFLWAVGPETVRLHELPPRAEIEAAAGRAHRELSVLDPLGARALAATLDELSRLVLAPVAAELDGRRLVVVADGALHYVPFSALPRPDAAGEILLDRHEVVHLPSISALALLRRGQPGHRTPERTLAVLADPVFGAGDERLAGGAPAAGSTPVAALEPAGGPRRGDRFVRLPATRDEAEAIAALLPPGEVWSALGFAARREAVLSGELAPFRFLHFATHGVIDTEHPEQSGLLLSRFTERGEPRDGFLTLGDIYGLDLAADLVVLSGCETALGRRVAGEGLVGLTRGFLHAGAERVMASLWRVQDQATAELMSRFYRGLLTDGLTPAAALRRAQLEVRRESRWRHPYFWAPFVLQGDWR